MVALNAHFSLVALRNKVKPTSLIKAYAICYGFLVTCMGCVIGSVVSIFKVADQYVFLIIALSFLVGVTFGLCKYNCDTKKNKKGVEGRIQGTKKVVREQCFDLKMKKIGIDMTSDGCLLVFYIEELNTHENETILKRDIYDKVKLKDEMSDIDFDPECQENKEHLDAGMAIRIELNKKKEE